MASPVVSGGKSFLLDMVDLEVLESEEMERRRRWREVRREKEFEL